MNTSSKETDTNYNADKMTLSVNPVDANGELAGNPEAFTYQITTGSAVGVISGSSVEGNVTLDLTTEYKVLNKDGSQAGYTTRLKQDETYYVTVKVGNLTVKNFTFTVKDTRVAPTVTIAKSSATVSATSGAALNSTRALAKLLQGAGVISTTATVDDITFVSANTSVISSNGQFDKATYGIPVTIVLKSVTVTDKTGTFIVAKTESIDLTVSKKTEAELAAEKLAEAKTAAEDALAEVPTITTEITDSTGKVAAARTAVNKYTSLGGSTTDLTDYSKLTTAESALQANAALVATATTKVEAYEAIANDLTTSAKIAAALAKLSTKSTGAGKEAQDAVDAVTNAASKSTLAGRITAADTKIKTAATVATVSVANVNIGKAHERTATLTVVVKNADEVELTANDFTDTDYAITYKTEVTAVAQGTTATEVTATVAMLLLTNDTTPTVTATVTNDSDGVDAGDNWTVTTTVTQAAVSNTKNTTATVTAE